MLFGAPEAARCAPISPRRVSGGDALHPDLPVSLRAHGFRLRRTARWRRPTHLVEVPVGSGDDSHRAGPRARQVPAGFGARKGALPLTHASRRPCALRVQR
jgi:hypothetical protein